MLAAGTARLSTSAKPAVSTCAVHGVVKTVLSALCTAFQPALRPRTSGAAVTAASGLNTASSSASAPDVDGFLHTFGGLITCCRQPPQTQAARCAFRACSHPLLLRASMALGRPCQGSRPAWALGVDTKQAPGPQPCLEDPHNSATTPRSDQNKVLALQYALLEAQQLVDVFLAGSDFLRELQNAAALLTKPRSPARQACLATGHATSAGPFQERGMCSQPLNKCA